MALVAEDFSGPLKEKLVFRRLNACYSFQNKILMTIRQQKDIRNPTIQLKLDPSQPELQVTLGDMNMCEMNPHIYRNVSKNSRTMSHQPSVCATQKSHWMAWVAAAQTLYLLARRGSQGTDEQQEWRVDIGMRTEK